MTKRKIEPQWTVGDELNLWVTCVGCSHEYYIESFELNPCCPICESKEYEESIDQGSPIEFGKLGGLF